MKFAFFLYFIVVLKSKDVYLKVHSNIFIFIHDWINIIINPFKDF